MKVWGQRRRSGVRANLLGSHQGPMSTLCTHLLAAYPEVESQLFSSHASYMMVSFMLWAMNAATETMPYLAPLAELSPSQKVVPATPWEYMFVRAWMRSGQK